MLSPFGCPLVCALRPSLPAEVQVRPVTAAMGVQAIVARARLQSNTERMQVHESGSSFLRPRLIDTLSSTPRAFMLMRTFATRKTLVKAWEVN
jgi:hypothetical protein